MKKENSAMHRTCQPYIVATPACRQAGFTLIEVMTVVLVMGILAAIAIPNYRDYVRRAISSEAPPVLADGRTRVEQYFLDNRTYASAAGSTTCGGFANRTENHFAYSCVAANTTPALTYTITATGSSGPVVGDVYTINESNQRRTTNFQGTAYSTAKTCWIVRGSEC
jgi:type IV pilus assembly protein PilE